MLKKFAALPMAALLCGVLSAHAQTSVALSALGSLQQATSTATLRQVPSNGAGFMLELRHVSNPLFGYDVSYSFHRADQLYEALSSSNGQPVNADAQALTLNWVVSLPLANVRVFALAGGGFQRFNPTGSQAGSTQSQTKGVFDYGAGFDWGLLPHLGLRFQYRGNVYKAPQLATAFSSTDKFTQDAEPMVGAYFNF